MNKEFFWTIFKRSAAKEDIFTECLAESLRQDGKLTERFLGVLLKGNRLGMSVAPIVEVQTQVPYPGSIPDIVLVAENGDRIMIENKMDAPEGKDQLKRYLSLHNLTALAFITRNSRMGLVEEDVIGDSRYLRPEGRDHFLWSDFHDTVEERSKEGGASPMVSSLLYLLQGLGQRPDRAQSRRWQDDTPEAERLREWILEPTLKAFERKGWADVIYDQIKREIYARQGKWPIMKRIWLNTWSSPGEFQIRVDFDESQNLELLLKKALKKTTLPQDHLTVEFYKPKKNEKDRKALDFFIAKENLFKGVPDDDAKRTTLRDFVIEIHKLYEK
jgi:hypothetical protein